MNYTPPKFANELPIKSDSPYETMASVVGTTIGYLGMIPCCFCCPNPYTSIHQGTIGLISHFGKYYKTVDPGLVNINPLAESIDLVDVRLQIESIGRMPIVTKDNVNITIESVVYWHIIDPYLATYGISDVRSALVERAQTTLRAVLGTRVLQDTIENRETIADDIRDMIDIPAKAWGVTVESILIKDLTFSTELQESLSSAATQKRIGESKIIAAQAEVDSAKLMREAADILNTPAAMQIRYLETMQHMSKGPNSKVLFVPMSHPSHAALDGGSALHSSVSDAVLQNQLGKL
ncbi:hypothetical protein BJ085DRAFT_17981 [Dimargaris cristalligena]|uniref:Band 7 domain-containing protein n=1 Tax=Dimargaris cristalligena TaxID=215637 RepID=A0A4Q0A207_9FUNG|nr:hypothetical protein BJ085DRAFT_17981 [Dimargaris cristalligena]|eukprot:RKP40125.1 hypothetical protein BJ085DRAFT_17981 [Dimargaris cristalligena]